MLSVIGITITLVKKYAPRGNTVSTYITCSISAFIFGGTLRSSTVFHIFVNEGMHSEVEHNAFQGVQPLTRARGLACHKWNYTCIVLMMEATSTSEMSVNFYETTRPKSSLFWHNCLLWEFSLNRLLRHDFCTRRSSV
jgi:hypothetical protein